MKKSILWLVPMGVVVVLVFSSPACCDLFDTYTLYVEVSEGVKGFPASGEHHYHTSWDHEWDEHGSGHCKMLDYEYQLQEGYCDLVVILDNIRVEPCGTIIMDRDHIVKVTARHSD